MANSRPSRPTEVTLEALPELLKADRKVKVAGVDVDGLLRGKILSKERFLSVASEGFGFCSAIFSWDMHDTFYTAELGIGNLSNGNADIVAVPDPSSFRRIPWEGNMPFFFLDFVMARGHSRIPVEVCPRTVLRNISSMFDEKGFRAYAGVEYEWTNFRKPPTSVAEDDAEKVASIPEFLKIHPPSALHTLTHGDFNYSLLRPAIHDEYHASIFDACEGFDCEIEGYHTESGHGSCEAALKFDRIEKMADKAVVFKFIVKSMGIKAGIIPTFMARPREGYGGNPGHMHISVTDSNGTNLFYRQEEELEPLWPEMSHISDFGRSFLAGLLQGLPDLIAIFCPTINSYKRFGDEWHRPISCWGLENRAAAIRVITPPTTKPAGTRFEVRIPGADANPAYVLAAIFGLGLRGVNKSLRLESPPLGSGVHSLTSLGPALPDTLADATRLFMQPESIARQVFGDAFVHHFGTSRLHEIAMWKQAVTDWEFRRYLEPV